ncbi:Cyclic nucleotide-binding domain-containing protein [Mariprofundus ferrinatatus]|uniref:Cyclic nucleotide-binding domain-containing protein n=1 Tax=Mariprofundus ferrinatatus TaxID=1921087 RepID=A0A2K8L2D3_9PROT|nr:cyclic nucleotide-binding domain-containing protein [Mariprofundus ferrinatatus]ATX81475.1 Cyclic nucleotide-binding domain-containing protein [Mariprofundus ferrinatatus]
MDRERLALLQSMPVFGGISDDALAFLLEHSALRNFAAGAQIFREGDPASSMFVVERGSVDVQKMVDGEWHKIRELGQGDCFGEMALLDLYPRSASVFATGSCTLIEISQKSLFGLYSENLEQFTIIQMNIGREISRRLRLTDEQLFQCESKPPS